MTFHYVVNGDGTQITDVLDPHFKIHPEQQIRCEEDDCDCKAPEFALHSEVCHITPIYASVVRDWGEDGDAPHQALRDISNAMAMRERHLFACALCGAVAYAEDMTPIYQAPLYNDNPGGPDYAYKYPKNLVKVVCSKHNRVTKAPAYQGVMPSGY